MNYSLLGTSQLKVSAIGFGCMSLSPDESLANPVIQKAIDSGINYFDTADIYQNGNNEVVLGKAIRGIRNRLIIASKAGNVVRADGKGLDWNPSREHILKSIEGSLKRLNTDYIDLYQLHGGTINDNIDETIEAFELLLKQGKIRYFGISSIRPNVISAYIKRSPMVSVMTQYSLLDRRPEEETLDLLKKSNISVVTRGSVGHGLLIDKPSRDYLELTAKQVHEAAEAVRSVSGAHRSPSQTAIRYVLHHPAVASAVIGIRTLQQLDEAVETINSPQLTAEEYRKLQESVFAMKYRDHRNIQAA